MKMVDPASLGKAKPSPNLATVGSDRFPLSRRSAPRRGPAPRPAVQFGLTVTLLVLAAAAQPAQVTISKNASPTLVAIGEPLTYTLVVTSVDGNSQAVVATDVLPAGLTFLQLIQSGGGSCTTPPVGGTGTVRCDLGDIPHTATRTIAFSVTPTVAEQVTNTACVDWRNPRSEVCSAAQPVVVVDPTRAAIGDFDVFWDASLGSAVVRWVTLEERGTRGFYLERSSDSMGDAGWELLHQAMLPGLIDAPLGGEYRFEDPTVIPGETYSYRLIELEVWGTERTHGPWRVTVSETPDVPGPGPTSGDVAPQAGE
jgi:uncharacterized repeat protein (TIGR01451 family)